MRRLGHLWRFAIESAPRWLMSLCMASMMIHVSADALGRYFFNAPLPATIEIASLYYLIPFAFLPLGALQKQDAHIRAELLNEQWAPRLTQWADRAGLLFSLVGGAFVTVWTTQEAWHRTMIGDVWESSYALIPAWPARWAVPLGIGLFTLASLDRLIREYRHVR